MSNLVEIPKKINYDALEVVKSIIPRIESGEIVGVTLAIEESDGSLRLWAAQACHDCKLLDFCLTWLSNGWSDERNQNSMALLLRKRQRRHYGNAIRLRCRGSVTGVQAITRAKGYEGLLMKVFYCDSFVGLYPVGTLAIIVASDSNFAAKGLEIQLKKEGMAQSISQDQMIEIDISEPSAKVILNGDY